MKFSKNSIFNAMFREGLPKTFAEPSPVLYQTGGSARDTQDSARLLDAQEDAGFFVRNLVLADGRRARMVVHGNIRRLEIETPTPQTFVVFEIYYDVDDYVCGVVQQSIIENVEVGDVTFESIGAYIQTEEGQLRITDDIARRKLAVDLYDIFITLGDSQAMSLHGVRFSQHRLVKPGKYTGYMRQVVQLLLGVGKPYAQTFEKAKIEEGEINRMSGAKPLPPVDSGTEVRFDYRFSRTHGIGWGDDYKTYVIQIGHAGVYAIPLTLAPVSLTEEGRARYQYLYPELFVPDLSGECLFDLLGGFPVAMLLPTAQDLDAWVNAGEAIKLSDDLSEFYSKQAYQESQGWAFAPRAPRAVNTCWHYGDGGIKEGFMYVVQWQIGSYNDPEPTVASKALAARLGFDEIWRKNKCHRMSEEQRNQVSAWLDDPLRPNPLTTEWIDEFTDKFDAIVVTPPTQGTAELREIGRGWLYHPSPYQSLLSCMNATGHPQIKFPNEEMNWNETFNFEPLDRQDHTPPPRCDTPMWACWVGDRLMVVYYYWRPAQQRPQSPQNTREPCQYTGTWVDYTPGHTDTHGYFYSNLFDLRRTVRTTGATMNRTIGTFAGTVDGFTFPEFFGTCACIRRNVYFQYAVDTQKDGGGRYSSALAIPFGDRSVIYSGEIKSVFDAESSYSISKPQNAGNTGYVRYGEIYEFVCHWAGCSCPVSGKTAVKKPNPCMMWELVPMDFSPNCLSSYGPPEFPEYQPCEENPTASGTISRADDAPLHCALNGTYNSSVSADSSYNESAPPRTTIEWVTRIWGDTELHSRTIYKGSVSGEDVTVRSDVPISYFWWLSSPVCDPPVFCKFEVGFNRFGHRLGNYHDDVDPFEVLHDGTQESMYSDPSAVFVGYVSEEVFDR